MQSSYRNRKKRKLKADINVVPYIDVMLVLLIIFMVTAPLLNLGLDIHLPQAAAKSVQGIKEAADVKVFQGMKELVVASVDKDGNFFLTLGGTQHEPIDADNLVRKVSAFVRA